MATEVVAARRRIIRRPRLTTMLDESSARIRLLIAPAGYGKTTLAREWLDEPKRNDVWYRGGPASADVAALAAGISESVGTIIPEAGKRMRERLRATGHPEEDVAILAELFAEDVQAWPSDAWLAIDDYQFAMESVASERFVDLLTQNTPMQMLITSRRRPSWATARRILYGEIQELDRRALAMEDTEARAVLGRTDSNVDELIARARGWAAVLGLASLAQDFVLPADDLPETLHSYFAEEVFQSTDPQARQDLAVLAIAPVVSPDLISEVLGVNRAREVIEVGTKLGILTEQRFEILEMHPLIQDFLRGRTSLDISEIAKQIGEYYLARDEWDYVFEVASRTSQPSLITQTIIAGLDPMLRQGRLTTVQIWIDFALSKHLDSPAVDLAEAELAFRRGEHERAHMLASQAAVRLTESGLGSRAHVRAGHSALLASKEEEGLHHFRIATELATTWEERREALVGLYFAASELGVADAVDALEQLETADERTPDGILRLEVLRLTRATRTGGLTRALQTALPKLHLTGRATDPLGLTAFLHMLANAANLSARYGEALELAEQQLAAASLYRLELPVVHAYLNQAIGQLGVRSYGRASDALDKVSRSLPPSGDSYLEAAIRAIRCRLLMAAHHFDEAVSLTDDFGETISSPPLRAEYLGFRAIALACCGETDDADLCLREAHSVFPPSIEVRVLEPCVRAIVSLRSSNVRDAERAAREAWDEARETGNFDSLVCGYRAEPQIVGMLFQSPRARADASELLVQSRDEALAKQLGLVLARSARSRIDSLTARELEVLDELEKGASNRLIAQRLFITEATVKAHLRHIYEKLGVRTRTELMAKAAKRQ